MLVLLVHGHHRRPVILDRLVERSELDLLRPPRLVADLARGDLVEVVRADSDEGALAGEVGVQLVLEVDEGGVAERGELDVAEDGRGEVGADLGRLGRDADDALLAWWGGLEDVGRDA